MVKVFNVEGHMNKIKWHCANLLVWIQAMQKMTLGKMHLVARHLMGTVYHSYLNLNEPNLKVIETKKKLWTILRQWCMCYHEQIHMTTQWELHCERYEHVWNTSHDKYWMILYCNTFLGLAFNWKNNLWNFNNKYM
jgi:hypothetical protein